MDYIEIVKLEISKLFLYEISKLFSLQKQFFKKFLDFFVLKNFYQIIVFIIQIENGSN